MRPEPALQARTSLVYRFEYFDNRTRMWTRSDAFATHDAIQRWHGVVLMATATEVEAERLSTTGVLMDGPPPPLAFIETVLDSRA